MVAGVGLNGRTGEVLKRWSLFVANEEDDADGSSRRRDVADARSPEADVVKEDEDVIEDGGDSRRGGVQAFFNSNADAGKRDDVVRSMLAVLSNRIGTSSLVLKYSIAQLPSGCTRYAGFSSVRVSWRLLFLSWSAK
jgi:hypothetical protein